MADFDKFEALRYIARRNNGIVKTTLLCPVVMVKDNNGQYVGHIPEWVINKCKLNGFEVIHADYKTQHITLKMVG